MMHIAYTCIPLYFQKIYKFSLFPQNLGFLLDLRFFISPYFAHDAFYASCLTRTGRPWTQGRKLNRNNRKEGRERGMELERVSQRERRE